MPQKTRANSVIILVDILKNNNTNPTIFCIFKPKSKNNFQSYGQHAYQRLENVERINQIRGFPKEHS